MTAKSKELELLKNGCADCQRCTLGKTRKNLVYGTGNADADLMFIGEAPGEQEDNTGIPFVGAAGKLFDRYLYAVDIAREEVYIANILKCRPPRNRDPLPEEEDACITHLKAQIALIQPRIIVCLGRIAAKRLIKDDFRITREHGIWFQKEGMPLICAIYHPSALLRDASKREDMLLDMQSIAARYRA